MTNEEFKNFAEAKILATEKNILHNKAIEYVGQSNDRLVAFKQIARNTGDTPEQVCLTLLHKHIQSISDFVITGEDRMATENIYERIIDARNYLLLLSALIFERADKYKKVESTDDITGIDIEEK